MNSMIQKPTRRSLPMSNGSPPSIKTRSFARRDMMRKVLSILAVAVASLALPDGVSAFQVEYPGGQGRDQGFSPQQHQRPYYCTSGDFGTSECDNPQITLTGSMDVQLPADADFELDVAGVLVSCTICQDGSCSYGADRATTETFHEWQGGASGTFEFEHGFRVNTTARDDQTAAAGGGPDSYNSYYCGLWLVGTNRGGEFQVVMPSDLYDPADATRRFALAESGVVTELTGTIN